VPILGNLYLNAYILFTLAWFICSLEKKIQSVHIFNIGERVHQVIGSSFR
jgi:succinate-acetate transporter protein